MSDITKALGLDDSGGDPVAAAKKQADDLRKNPAGFLSNQAYQFGELGWALPNFIGGEIDKNKSEAGPDPTGAGQDSQAEALRKKQQDYAKEFRSNIPGMEGSMSNALKGNNSRNMYSNLDQVDQDSSRRGLLYGGLAAGREGGVRAKAQGALGEGLAGIHQGLLNAADTLDAQAIQTGLGIQQNQQAIQNQIYQQAMAANNANNSMVGSMVGTIATIAALA